MSITNNNSNILRKDASDILDQIRKRAEDISTSEGSNFIFYNLSNPTNLTNPKIITLRKNDNLITSEITKNSNRRPTKRRTRNKSRPYRRNKEMGENNLTDLHDQFLINQQIKKLILRKKENITFNKSHKNLGNIKSNKKFFHLTQKRLGKKLRKNRTLDVEGEEGKDIWDKLRENVKEKKEKTIRVNERKYITARDYISTTKHIQLLKYIRKNKLEKLNMLVNIKNAEINTLNSNIESLENSKELIMANYERKYIKYINYLKRQKDKEEKTYIDLLIKSSTMKKEIFRLQTRINKVQREKLAKLNLILLFIQIKEHIKTVPEMALIAFGTTENNITNDLPLLRKTIARETIRRLSFFKNIDINKINENNLNSQDMKKIMKYKGKMIFTDADEIGYYLNKMEGNIRNKLTENENLKNEIKNLKSQYNQIKEEVEYDPDDDRRKYLMNILNLLKYKNEQLKSELNSIIIKYKAKNDKNKHKLIIVTNNTYKSNLKHSSSAVDLFHLQTNRTNTKNQLFNTIQTNENSTIYSPKTILSFKKYFSIPNFDFNTASNLFLSCYNLFSAIKQNSFLEQDLKFDIDIKRGSSTDPEKDAILKMVEYIINAYHLLMKEKNFYLSNKLLKKKYEKIRDLVDKENRRMKLIKNFRKDEEIRKEKLKKLNFKKDKLIYITTHKIENKYFLKAQKEQITKAINLAGIKKPAGFEDFMYDVMV